MFNRTRTCHSLASLLVAATAPLAGADVITDWNTRANEFIMEAKMGTPPAVRLMAMVQTAVDESVGEITRVSTTGVKAGEPLPNADAAVAAARDAGIAISERAAAAVLAARATDGAPPHRNRIARTPHPAPTCRQ